VAEALSISKPFKRTIERLKAEKGIHA